MSRYLIYMNCWVSKECIEGDYTTEYRNSSFVDLRRRHVKWEPAPSGDIDKVK